MEGQDINGALENPSLDAAPQATYLCPQGARAILGAGSVGARTYEPVIRDVIADAVTYNSSPDDDEMLRWLHYPAEDLVDKSYCSDFFGALPLSLMVPETSVRRICELEGEQMSSAQTPAEVAMALGYGRVTGLLKQPGLEAFAKVRTTLMPPSFGCQISDSKQQILNFDQQLGSKKEDVSPPSFVPSSLPLPSGSRDHVNLPVSTCSSPVNQMNYVRSLPTGISELAKCHSSSANHIHQPSNPSMINVNNHADGSTSESATSHGDASRFHGKLLDSYSTSMKNECSQADCSFFQEPFKAALSQAHKKGFVYKLHVDTCQHSTTPGSAYSKETVSPQLGESVDHTEATSSGVSENLGSKMAPHVQEKGSRKSEISTDLQNEYAGESNTLSKKPAGGRSSSKRNRAAEVHNLSERRRRDRINEKMKALRELIPNSDKSDKASILDDAIEYVKLLQLQIQMMFLRTGMTVPPTLLPTGMQQLQTLQGMALPTSEMGFSLGNGIGLGMSLPNTSTTGHPAYAVQSLTCAAHFPTASIHTIGIPNYLQSSSFIDTSMGFNDHQRLALQPLNVDFWNPYMMHQLHHHQFPHSNEQNQLPNDVIR